LIFQGFFFMCTAALKLYENTKIRAGGRASSNTGSIPPQRPRDPIQLLNTSTKPPHYGATKRFRSMGAFDIACGPIESATPPSNGETQSAWRTGGDFRRQRNLTVGASPGRKNLLRRPVSIHGESAARAKCCKTVVATEEILGWKGLAGSWFASR